MLYIDQPNQVGFSYDVPTNGTRDLVSGNTTAVDFSTTPIPEQNNTFYVGTFSSENQNTTTNDTQNSARALWHFAQAWFQEFPAYKPNDDRISIWTESVCQKSAVELLSGQLLTLIHSTEVATVQRSLHSSNGKTSVSLAVPSMRLVKASISI